MRLARIGGLVVGLLAMSAAAMAQNPNPTVGQKVWITMADASVHHGRVARVTPEAVTLTIDGASAELAARDMRRIEAPDRVGDGVARGAIGLAIAGGLGNGLLAAAICEHNCASYVMKMGLAGAVLGGAAGAIVGGLLDAGNPGREVIFDRTSLTIAPVITARSRSVAVHVRW